MTNQTRPIIRQPAKAFSSVSVLQSIVRVVMRSMYRITTVGRERIPLHGAALLVCNHVSFVDALLIGSECPRPIRFVMDAQIFRSPLLGWFFRTVRAIPIVSRKTDSTLAARAFDHVAEALANGELVCIFPEGMITHDGALNPFRKGVEEIVQRTPVPVIPIALQGLWGSFFSRKGGAAMSRWPRRFWSRISVTFGDVVPPSAVSADDLQSRVSALLAADQ